MLDSSLHTATSSGPYQAIELDVLDGSSQSQRPQSSDEIINDEEAQNFQQASEEPIARAPVATIIGGGATDPGIPIGWRVIIIGFEVLGAILG